MARALVGLDQSTMGGRTMDNGIGIPARYLTDLAPAREDWALKDVLVRHRLLALDRRYLFALPNITVGRVTEETVRELEQIAVEFETLLRGDPSISPRFSEAAVRVRIGDALGSAAWACEALQEPGRARALFMAAAVIHGCAGADEKARRCRTEFDRLNFYHAGEAPVTARPAPSAAC
jgi:hypothetical protein